MLRVKKRKFLSLIVIVMLLASMFAAVVPASADNVAPTYYVANLSGPFVRSTTPFSATDAAYSVGQEVYADGSIGFSAQATGYADSGFVVYDGTLGDLSTILVQGTSGSSPFGLNLWFDTNNDGEFFTWNNNIMSSLGGDLYGLGPGSNSDNILVNGQTSFYMNEPANNYYNFTLAQLQAGSYSGINKNTKVAVWIGVSVTGASAQARISSVTFGPPSQVWVNAGWNGTTTGTQVGTGEIFGYNAFAAVQDGVNGVAAGGTVEVAAGNYPEQITITQGLTLEGAGATTIIEPGSSLAVNATKVLSGSPEAPGIWVKNSSDVTIENLTVDGSGNNISSSDLSGVYFDNSSGALENTTLQNWTPAGNRGSGYGHDVIVETDSNGSANVTIENNTITGYGKGGIFAAGPYTTVAVTGNTVTSQPTGDVTTNGIEVDYKATGTVSDNTVTGNDYTATLNSTDPQAAYAAGILLYGAGGSNTQLSGNTLTDNQIDIATVASSATVDSNTIAETGAGIGIYSVPADSNTPYLTSYIPAVPTGGYTVTVTNNDITGGISSWGIWVASYNYTVNGKVTASLTGNTLSGAGSASVGLEVGDTTLSGAAGSASVTAQLNHINGWQTAVLNEAGDTTSTTLYYNDLSGNTVCIDNNNSSQVVAPDNWCGSTNMNTSGSGDVLSTPCLPTSVLGPTINPNGGSISATDTVGIGYIAPGYTAYYTITNSDTGTMPTVSSSVYLTPFTVSTSQGAYTVEAAVDDTIGWSNPASATFTVTPVNSTTVSATVSPAVGDTVSLGTAASVTIPAGALNGSANVTVTVQSVPSPQVAPAGYTVLGAYDFTVNGQQNYSFNNNITLTFTFNPSNIPAGTSPAVYYYDGTTSSWVLVTGGVVNLTNDTITVTVNHFTTFAVIATATTTATTAATGGGGGAAGAPVVFSVSPNTGSMAGGTSVTISGNNLTAATAVTFGTVAATGFTVNGNGTITATLPAGTVGTVYVTVTTPGGTSTVNPPADQFTYTVPAPPVLVPTPVKGAIFTDVPNSFWAYGDIENLSGLGYISGYPDGTFKPNNPITRAEFVTVMDKVLKLTPAPAEAGTRPQTPTFTDVNPGDWFYQTVETAVYAGVAVGSGGSMFDPNAPITRQEICIVLEKGLGKNSQALADALAKTDFTDDASISSWAHGFVALASQDGLIKGYPDGSFEPLNSATRAEACVMISDFLKV